MKPVMPERFKQDFDNIQAEIQSLYDKKSALNEPFRYVFNFSLYDKEPPTFSFNFIGGWIIAFYISLASLIFTCADYIESDTRLPLSLFVIAVICCLTFLMRGIIKEKEQKKYETNVEKWKLLKPQFDKLSSDIQIKHRELRAYIAKLYRYIQIHRDRIRINGIQMRRLSYYHNQYISQTGKYAENWEDVVEIIYSILFGETTDVTSTNVTEQTHTPKTQTNQNKEQKIDDALRHMRLEISNQIDKNAPNLAIEKKYDLREALVRIKAFDNIDWLSNIGYSENEIQQIVAILEVKEQKRLVNHKTFEGRISAKDKAQIKETLGYDCMACGMNMANTYGEYGKNYIELHHKIPYANMEENDTRTLSISDFVVLCPNCHSIIHRLNDAGDVELLKTVIRLNLKKPIP